MTGMTGNFQTTYYITFMTTLSIFRDRGIFLYLFYKSVIFIILTEFIFLIARRPWSVFGPSRIKEFNQRFLLPRFAFSEDHN